MSISIEQLAEQAMKLSSESRARLADILVESLDSESLGGLEQLWVAEASRRRDEIRAGIMNAVPGDEARQSIRDIIKR